MSSTKKINFFNFKINKLTLLIIISLIVLIISNSNKRLRKSKFRRNPSSEDEATKNRDNKNNSQDKHTSTLRKSISFENNDLSNNEFNKIHPIIKDENFSSSHKNLFPSHKNNSKTSSKLHEMKKYFKYDSEDDDKYDSEDDDKYDNLLLKNKKMLLNIKKNKTTDLENEKDKEMSDYNLIKKKHSISKNKNKIKDLKITPEPLEKDENPLSRFNSNKHTGSEDKNPFIRPNSNKRKDETLSEEEKGTPSFNMLNPNYERKFTFGRKDSKSSQEDIE